MDTSCWTISWPIRRNIIFLIRISPYPGRYRLWQALRQQPYAIVRLDHDDKWPDLTDVSIYPALTPSTLRAIARCSSVPYIGNGSTSNEKRSILRVHTPEGNSYGHDSARELRRTRPDAHAGALPPERRGGRHRSSGSESLSKNQDPPRLPLRLPQVTARQ